MLNEYDQYFRKFATKYKIDYERLRNSFFNYYSQDSLIEGNFDTFCTEILSSYINETENFAFKSMQSMLGYHSKVSDKFFNLMKQKVEKINESEERFERLKKASNIIDSINEKLRSDLEK